MAQDVSFIFTGYCDPRTRFIGLMPMQLQGVAQDINSIVTNRNDVLRPQVYVGWPETTTPGAVTQYTPGPTVSGMVSQANCGAGEAIPDMVRCAVSIDLPWGKIGIDTPRIDPTTINLRTDPCGIQMAKFENILRGGYERSDMVNRLGNLAKQIGMPEQMVSVDMTSLEFGKAFQIWKAIAWLSKRDRGMVQNGNPSNTPTAAYVEHYGMWRLLKADDTLYTCGASGNAFGTNLGKETMPFELKRWMVGGSDNTLPIQVDKHPTEFYEAVNDQLHCIALRYRRYDMGVKPKLVIPTGMWLDFVRGYVYGSLGVQSFQNMGASVRDELQAAINGGVINTRDFGQVRVIEDDTLAGASTTKDSTGSTVTAPAGYTYVTAQVIPDGPVNGEDALQIQYLGYDYGNQDDWVKVVDADTAEDGRLWGRYRIIEHRDSACRWWTIETRKRLVPNYPFLTGVIGDFAVRAQTCSPS